jgi:RNA polymerase sigma-70 factor (ECF subfamily)
MIMESGYIERLKAGEESAYKDLFSNYYAQLTAFAYKFIQDKEISKDIVQHLFVKIYNNRSALTIESSIKHYLFRAIHNECLNMLKKETVREMHHRSYSEQLDTSYNYDQGVEQTDKEHKLYQAIEKLPEKCTQVFVMSRIEGIKNPEIAIKLEISVRTVETHISNALKSLRESLLSFLILF